jgi:hypothetical protein
VGSAPLRYATFILIAGLVAGCASTPAIVQSGPGTFSVSKEAVAPPAGKLKAEALQDASQYCAKNGREALMMGAREERTDYMVTYNATAKIDFRCVATQTMRETTKAAVLECRDRRLKKEFKTYRQSAECSNPKIVAAYEAADYPYMDLVHVLVDARLVMSENLDKGAITEAQAQSQSTELENRLTSEDQRRRAAAANAQSVVGSADPGVYLQGLTAFQETKRVAKRAAAQKMAFACDRVGFEGGLSTTDCY